MQNLVPVLLGTVLWSFGFSVAALLGLMFLDWVENRRVSYGSAKKELRAEPAQLPKRPQLTAAPRRRQNPGKQAVKAA